MDYCIRTYVLLGAAALVACVYLSVFAVGMCAAERLFGRAARFWEQGVFVPVLFVCVAVSKQLRHPWMFQNVLFVCCEVLFFCAAAGLQAHVFWHAVFFAVHAKVCKAQESRLERPFVRTGLFGLLRTRMPRLLRRGVWQIFTAMLFSVPLQSLCRLVLPRLLTLKKRSVFLVLAEEALFGYFFTVVQGLSEAVLEFNMCFFLRGKSSAFRALAAPSLFVRRAAIFEIYKRKRREAGRRFSASERSAIDSALLEHLRELCEHCRGTKKKIDTRNYVSKMQTVLPGWAKVPFSAVFSGTAEALEKAESLLVFSGLLGELSGETGSMCVFLQNEAKKSIEVLSKSGKEHQWVILAEKAEKIFSAFPRAR